MNKLNCIEWTQLLLIGIGCLFLIAPAIYRINAVMRSRSLFKRISTPAFEPVAKENSELTLSYQPVPAELPYKPFIRIEEAEKGSRPADLKKTAKMHIGRILRSSQQLLNSISPDRTPEPTSSDVVPDTSSMWMKRIFILDDDVSAAMTLALLVSNLGYEPVTCQSPTDALARLLAEPFDLLITDYQMLLLNGLQIAQKLRNDDCKISIVLISGDVSDIDLFLAHQLEVRAILAKPLNVTRLKEVLEAILSTVSSDPLQESSQRASHEQKANL